MNSDLYHAITKDDIEKVSQLISINNINEYDNDGETALHIASEFGAYKVATYLIKSGAEVNHQNENSEFFTPLFYAVIQNEIGIARLLLDNGANPNLKNIDDRTAISQSESYMMENLIKMYT